MWKVKAVSVLFIFLKVSLCNFSLADKCSRVGEPVKWLSPMSLDPNIDIQLKFDNESVVVGEGSNGVVRQIQLADGSLVAVKRMEIGLLGSDLAAQTGALGMLANELFLLDTLGQKGVGPKLFACVLGEEEVFIVQQQLSVTLTGRYFKLTHRKRSRYERLMFFKQVFDHLAALWKLGWVHRDVKPDNLMLGDDDERLYLIDFGSAWKPGQEFHISGSPYFMSEDQFIDKAFVFESDLYAAALSIAAAESSLLRVFSFDRTQKLLPVFNGYQADITQICFRMGRVDRCIPELVRNVRQVLEEAGYGPYDPRATPANINFTTLLIQAIRYKKSGMTVDRFLMLFNMILLKEEQKLLDLRRQEDQRLQLDLEHLMLRQKVQAQKDEHFQRMAANKERKEAWLAAIREARRTERGQTPQKQMLLRSESFKEKRDVIKPLLKEARIPQLNESAKLPGLGKLMQPLSTFDKSQEAFREPKKVDTMDESEILEEVQSRLSLLMENELNYSDPDERAFAQKEVDRLHELEADPFLRDQKHRALNECTILEPDPTREAEFNYESLTWEDEGELEDVDLNYSKTTLTISLEDLEREYSQLQEQVNMEEQAIFQPEAALIGSGKLPLDSRIKPPQETISTKVSRAMQKELQQFRGGMDTSLNYQMRSRLADKKFVVQGTRLGNPFTKKIRI